MTVTATTDRDRIGWYAHCGCGWEIRTVDAKSAALAAWRHRCVVDDSQQQEMS